MTVDDVRLHSPSAVRPRSAIVPWSSPAAQQRLAQLERELTLEGAAGVATAVSRAQHGHRSRIDHGVMLYGGTNIMSPAVTALHDGALSTRPAQGWPGEKEQTAVEEIEELEVLAIDQVARALRGRYAEVRYLSATMANLAAYIAFTEPGDTIAVLSPEAGGHISHQMSGGAAGIRGLNVVHLPYAPDEFDVDAGALDRFVDEVRPRLIVIGGSVTLFPHDIGPVRAAADRVGAVLVYDASHTAGLIAAGFYQDPIAEGADVVTFSTYKTFAGPPGGAAVTNNPEYAEQMALAAYPALLSNYDPSRLGPLAVAAAEAVEQQPAWAAPTIDTAVEFATQLRARGLDVVGEDRGYTRSHQLVIDAGRLGGAWAAIRRLEAVGIFAGHCRLPWQTPESPPAALRFGTQEFVRRGGGLDIIPALADITCRALTDADADPVQLRAAVAELGEHLRTDLWGRPARAAADTE